MGGQEGIYKGALSSFLTEVREKGRILRIAEGRVFHVEGTMAEALYVLKQDQCGPREARGEW